MATQQRDATTTPEPSHRGPLQPDGCVACGCRLALTLFDIGDFHYVRCPGCGLAHLDPVPSAAELESFFDEGYFTGRRAGGYDDYARDAPLHRRNAKARVRDVMRAVAPPGRLLDVGCALGYMLEAAGRAGFEAEGVEVSPVLAQRVRAGGFRITEALALVAEEQPESFDVVTMYQVLAHVAEPDRFLADAVRCLHPGGVLLIETWNRESLVARALGRHWQIVAPPSVVWLDARRPLELMLTRAGASVVSFDVATKWVSFGFVASLLDAPQRAESLVRIGRLLRRVPPTLGVPYALGDLVTVVARRSDGLSLAG
ncbi:MAG: Methyltransferase type 11 [Actinomycetia bacterium]|nr:Methyltransferase type 11 [Actinomycetes bacterium]